MADTRDVVIIGAGHNGLVTAFYLAKAGFKPLLLERRAQPGGGAITEQFHPGFRCSTLSHVAGPIRPEIVRDMELEKHGLKLVAPETEVFAPNPDGRALFLYNGPAQSAREIAKFSVKDASAFREFQEVLGRIGEVMKQVLSQAPPDVDNPTPGEMWGILKTGRSLRNLGKKDMYRLLRWGPMAVADLAAEWFETELLRAIIAARGIFGAFLGPWSAGSSLLLLMRAAEDRLEGSSTFAMGGAGAVTQAMASAAVAAGAEIRINADVQQIIVKDGVATGVVLAGGEEIPAKAVISNADPKRTLLKFVDPGQLDPEFVAKLQHYRCYGAVGKINLALSGLPQFKALGNMNGASTAALSGRIHIGPEIDYLEHAFDDAKYGNFSRQPYLEATIPSITDPSLAPQGQHVMSIYVQFAPYQLKNADWNAQRVPLADAVVKTLAAYAPNLPSLILTHQIITPKDLEQTYGFTGGHIFHGELALDQVFTMRPLLGWAKYRTPIQSLYLCGSGTHPGSGLTGASGANAAREILKEIRK